MRLPRNVSATDLVRQLENFGYKITRQTGSHIRLTTSELGQHHITIPNHDPIRIGTFSSILSDVANHFGVDRSEVLKRLNL